MSDAVITQEKECVKINRGKKFLALDILYIAMMVLPIVTAITLKVLFTPASKGVTITGPLVYFRIPFIIQDFIITESQINSALVIITILGICLYLTHGLSIDPTLKRQHIAEIIVEKAKGLVSGNMGEAELLQHRLHLLHLLWLLWRFPLVQACFPYLAYSHQRQI